MHKNKKMPSRLIQEMCFEETANILDTIDNLTSNKTALKFNQKPFRLHQ